MAGAGAKERTTVVVANDDPTVREVVARILEADGCDAIRLDDSTSVADAVTKVSADAVVLDLGAQNLAQLESLRSAGGARGEAVRAVVIGTGPAAAVLAWQADADAVLTRPFAATELQQAVTEALARPDNQRAAHRATEARTLPL